MQQRETERCRQRTQCRQSPEHAWGKALWKQLFVYSGGLLGSQRYRFLKPVLQALLVKALLVLFRSWAGKRCGCPSDEVLDNLNPWRTKPGLPRLSPLSFLGAAHWAPHSASSTAGPVYLFSKRKRIGHEYQQVLLQLFEHNSVLRLASTAAHSNFMS